MIGFESLVGATPTYLPTTFGALGTAHLNDIFITINASIYLFIEKLNILYIFVILCNISLNRIIVSQPYSVLHVQAPDIT